MKTLLRTACANALLIAISSFAWAAADVEIESSRPGTTTITDYRLKTEMYGVLGWTLCAKPWFAEELLQGRIVGNEAVYARLNGAKRCGTMPQLWGIELHARMGVGDSVFFKGVFKGTFQDDWLGAYLIPPPLDQQ